MLSSKRTGAWTQEEDTRLQSLVRAHGVRSWVLIAKFVPGRSAKSCRLRWCNQLCPGVLKSPFSEWEQAVIVRAQEAHPNKWSTIARLLPGRTDNSIKNHWNATLHRKMSSPTEGLANSYLDLGCTLDWLLSNRDRPASPSAGGASRAACITGSLKISNSGWSIKKAKPAAALKARTAVAAAALEGTGVDGGRIPKAMSCARPLEKQDQDRGDAVHRSSRADLHNTRAAAPNASPAPSGSCAGGRPPVAVPHAACSPPLGALPAGGFPACRTQSSSGSLDSSETRQPALLLSGAAAAGRGRSARARGAAASPGQAAGATASFQAGLRGGQEGVAHAQLAHPWQHHDQAAARLQQHLRLQERHRQLGRHRAALVQQSVRLQLMQLRHQVETGALERAVAQQQLLQLQAGVHSGMHANCAGRAVGDGRLISPAAYEMMLMGQQQQQAVQLLCHGAGSWPMSGAAGFPAAATVGGAVATGLAGQQPQPCEQLSPADGRWPQVPLVSAAAESNLLLLHHHQQQQLQQQQLDDDNLLISPGLVLQASTGVSPLPPSCPAPSAGPVGRAAPPAPLGGGSAAGACGLDGAPWQSAAPPLAGDEQLHGSCCMMIGDDHILDEMIAGVAGVTAADMNECFDAFQLDDCILAGLLEEKRQ